MTMQDAKREAISVASALIDKLQIESLPVDVFDVAEQLGIEVHKDIEIPDDDISGLIKRRGKDGRPVILLNNNHSRQRQRFTLAHEVAHYLLHVLDPLHIDRNHVYFRDSASALAIDPKEVQANQFAAELLMPRKLLLQDLRDKKIDTDLADCDALIRHLAKKYDVSQQAMTIRIGTLLVS